MATTPTAQQLAITNLYTALFNRAPDANGLAFWTGAILNGASLDTITQGFLNSPESNAIYLPAYTSEQFISAFYATVFGRAPDSNGLDFWVKALEAAGGQDSLAAKALVVSQINTIINSPLDTKPADLTDAEYAQTLADRATFANKVAVGVYFALDTPGTNLDLAKKALAPVNANPSTVDNGKQVADGTPLTSSPSAPAVTVPTLRLIEGTEGADTFDFTHLTIGVDTIVDGLGGDDTLNYVDSSSTGMSFPAIVVRNVETINIRNVNTAGTSAESVRYNTPLNLPVGESLTLGGITVTATGGNATGTEIAAAIASGATNGNAAVSGALPGYTKVISGTSVILTSTVLGNVPDLRVSGTSFNTGAIGSITQGGNGTRDYVGAASLTNATLLNSDLSTAAISFNGMLAGQKLGVIGNNVITNGDVNGNYLSDVTTATVVLTGGTKMSMLTLTGTGLGNVLMTSTGLANQVTSLMLSSATTALEVNAATNLLIGTPGVVASGTTSGAALRTVTVSGAASSVALGTISSTVLSSIDASGLTGGGVSATISSPTVTFTGGGGNDFIGLAAGVVITSAIDAGAGSADTIGFTTSASLTTDTAALITGFEVLQLSAQSGVQTYDTTLIAGITAIKVAQSLGSVALTKLGAGAALTVSGSVSGAGLSLSLDDDSGNADILDLTLDNGLTPGSGLGGGVSLSTLKAVNVETITLHSKGWVLEGLIGNAVINDEANTTLSKVVIDGDQPISFDTGSLTNSVPLTIDASAATAYLMVNGHAATKAFSVNVASTGASIRSGNGGDAITLASSGPAIDTIIYTSASQSRQDFVNAAGTAAATQDEIVNFQFGADKINLAGLNLAADRAVLVSKNFATTTDLVTAESSADFFKDGDGVTRGVVAATVGADTYVIVDANRNGLFNAENDLVIKLAGVTAIHEVSFWFT
ncbi:DUF4214 domain-containing protein [Pigmentiphaga aceris]|uniref:DUF4214 domain-containing protein n=1 Tax=Pigmentiphaga aceris TaxID=1940612 RepID=A0A5C0AZW8_9BURK|nr:DUF4214 domain-containing protein [Pigmentiphaga aceris]QEI07164.1 DUF4214 domain-containing protein [Pigmentiphaga aceris]